ncbi:pseudouridine synthase [Acholeplasma hippikon]|uniref:Pseudouridine synthase n=1 Tax=Acholeplasma hippikon TaxID=264636 RepID=A0A449BL42_9MOLU|nr:pseudouridine synthase [Acholeplasma hippikon]VEU83191.1 Pseudouridine synthase [Acholeplasma hippikon]
MRLDKLLSNLKYGSRKEIKELINGKSVLVNGLLVKDADIQIDPKYDKISINGKEVFYKELIILALYKPVGYLSANTDRMHPVLFDLINEPYSRFELKMAGRLDLDAEGLMLLTTDGELVHRLTNPKHHVDKLYEVTLDKVFNEESKIKLLNGVELIDTDNSSYIAVAKSLEFDGNIASIVIDEGKFHQVKKMFKSVEFEVTRLVRKQIGNLKLDLNPGEYKEVTIEDIF